MELIKKECLQKLDVEATGQRIQELMRIRNVTIRDICGSMDVSFQAVYKWQKGEALPTISNFYILGQLLEVDVDDVLVAKEK